ncbi:hypothetical protein K491DRAFT_781440 [Lophiostoma macrostomum CBS 122681]|uniref:Uncharacterized protein n=1 Tax=Lophiostoma macrostomum CBS 122681 TaxID=1314788 RepID=A0A6A6SZH7_9PLEO|nr:hypothetical protein K491DRAFT_781440 [Lophiostoma macrostomum CBS 122681]
MQLTTLTLTSLLAALAAAAPGTPVQERQATPTVYARFYPDAGCHGDWVDDTVFAQSQTGCYNNGITSPYNSTFFSGNTLTCTLRIYSLPNCPVNQGNYFDLQPGVDNCFAQKVGSAQFINC